MELTAQQESKLLAKLRQPLYINYVSWLLKCTNEESKQIINKMVDDGKIVEYNPKVAKNYYVIKN
jgi:GTP-dependent phosphoenolpyruvate carboxykinase